MRPARAGEAAQPLPFSPEPGKTGAVTERHRAPQNLGHEDGPKPAEEKPRRVVACQDEKLAACDKAHDVGVPAAERRASEMPRPCAWHIAAGEAESGAAQAEIHVFQVRAEGWVKDAYFFKNLCADEGGGPGWRMNFAFQREKRGVG